MRVLRRTGAPDIAVRVAGETDRGVPVVLVHGMASDNSTWRRLACALRARGRAVVSVDLRGHGRSGRAQGAYRLDDFRDDLTYVLDTLDISTVDLVGHSLGAHTALRFAMSQPSRVRRLVLEEVPPMPRDEADLSEGIAVKATLGEQIRGLLALVRNPFPVIRYDGRMGDEIIAEFDVSAPHWWSGLPGVRAAAMVISGGDKSFLPPRHLRSLSDALPDSRFVTIEAGHSVHRDRGAEFISHVEEFLAY
ncbi:alpha/beta fold hydrolase [Gordonia jinghuaiqii]|uniref:Alpha/beta fold hydrolase n=1 Tax=Gordonia jinghuaiqii TaxID=2758710 RepID=A0A7D7QG47_9ACTN|nr:alpha/beta fold hydrolase [Gordonia jinghuaiqii]MCR5979433.1 alpha/beta fold hydrolase [Gordonia jinghuaiqii]MCR5979854.1 alpha/beta fold hydrolase [Gordonia jinghuaiqii]QMT00762.1 alpha/beta fold hydrolase [Gordonia jinghuaiqii]